MACTVLVACAEDPPSAGPPKEPTSGLAGEAEADSGEATHLGVSAHTLARARREAVGLSRMPPSLRIQTLVRRRQEPQPSYAELRADADAHLDASVSFEGRVGLVRPAGPHLWILALHTRRDGERWVDPLYVLSVLPPRLPADGGARARVDGWAVGPRTIGQHTLPLVVAYEVEALDDGALDDGAADHEALDDEAVEPAAPAAPSDPG